MQLHNNNVTTVDTIIARKKQQGLSMANPEAPDDEALEMYYVSSLHWNLAVCNACTAQTFRVSAQLHILLGLRFWYLSTTSTKLKVRTHCRHQSTLMVRPFVHGRVLHFARTPRSWLMRKP